MSSIKQKSTASLAGAPDLDMPRMRNESKVASYPNAPTKPWSSGREQMPAQAHSTKMGAEQSLVSNKYPEAFPPRPIIKDITTKASQILDDVLPIRSNKALRPLLLGSRSDSTNVPTENVEGKIPEVIKPFTPSHGTPPTLTEIEKLNIAQQQGKQSESLGPSVEDEHSSYTLSTGIPIA